jgi:hypothetical protein
LWRCSILANKEPCSTSDTEARRIRFCWGDTNPALIGDANSDIVLQSMSDKGNAGAAEKGPAADFVILRVELKLKSTAG